MRTSELVYRNVGAMQPDSDTRFRPGAERTDLVVLSAHGYSGESRWPYGGVTLNIIVYGTTPVLIVQDLSPDEIQRSPAEAAFRERRGH